MTTVQPQHLTRPLEVRGRSRGNRPAVRAARSRRTGMVSEAVVARYVRDLSAQGRRVHRAAERPQVVAR